MDKSGVALCHSVEPLEGGVMVLYSLGHNVDLSPVRPEDPYLPGGHAVFYNDFQAPVPVQVIVRLLEVQ